MLSKDKVVSNQVRYSLVERSIETGLLRYWEENHVTVMAFKPPASGLSYIKEKNPEGILGKVAEVTGNPEAQVALKWCILKEAVVAIPKVNSIDHVVQNCKASDWRLTSDQMKLLDDGFRSRQRGRNEAALRRLARRALQRFGHSL